MPRRSAEEIYADECDAFYNDGYPPGVSSQDFTDGEIQYEQPPPEVETKVEESDRLRRLEEMIARRNGATK